MKMYVTGESVGKSRNLVVNQKCYVSLFLRASSDITGLFQNMFPGSAIAKNFACGKTKIKYLICFGIAPYFREKLTKDQRSRLFDSIF